MTYICLIKLINTNIMTETNSKATHSRFDRYEIFEGNDLRLVNELITSLIGGKSMDLTNKLFGLFDGYLYNDLLELASDQLESDQYQKLSELVEKIKNH